MVFQGRTQLDENRVEEAVVSLRRARNRNPGDREYAGTFAHALSAAGRADDARRVLVSLRESSPERSRYQPGARAARGDAEQVVEATRYFHSAPSMASGPMARGGTPERPSSWCGFCYAMTRRTSAVAELIALTTNLPDTAGDRVEADS